MSENKKKTVYAKAVGVFLLSVIAYYVPITYLYFNTSPHWVWGLYLSPIFITFVFLSCLMFIHIELENKNRSDSEEDFCLTLVILSFMLMWWPIFLLIYLQVYEEILMIFEPIKGDLVQFQNITYESENYVILMFNLSKELGYGCQTDHYHASITTTPLPYNFYDINSNLTNIKLPSWLCGEINSPIPDQLYQSANKINGQRIIAFEYPNYVDSFFKIFIGSIFQCACIFTSVLLLSILLILGQENIESSIRKPSRKRRMYAFISSYILYVCVFSTNNLWIVSTSLLIGAIFLIFTLQSQIHRHFIYLIKGLIGLGNQNTLMKIIMVFIAFVFTLIYLPFIFISSQMVFHFKIFLGRHFVALYQGQPEEPLEQYDYYVNIWTIFSWLWYLILIIELNVLHIGTASYVITMIMCITQLFNLIIAFCYRNKSQPFLKQQWKIYYTTYKIIQQTEDEQQEEKKERQIKDIELQFQ